MTIREFAKLNNFPIRGKLTRIPDEVEYDFNDRPHRCSGCFCSRGDCGSSPHRHQ